MGGGCVGAVGIESDEDIVEFGIGGHAKEELKVGGRREAGSIVDDDTDVEQNLAALRIATSYKIH